MKKEVLFILIIVFSNCSKLDVTQEILPEIVSITPLSIETNLPVINIEVDEQEFLKMTANPNSKIEIEGKLDIYERKNEKLTDKSITIEIKGRTSVGTNFPVKSMEIIPDEAIETRVFTDLSTQSLLQNHNLDSLKIFRLRNSGNDFGITMIKDLAYSQYARDLKLNLELMYGTSVQVFINGKYYGLVNLRTENNVLGISNLLNVPSSDICILKVKNLQTENLEFHHGDKSASIAILEAIDIEDFEAIRNLVDEDNFIDYIIYQDYIGNSDWHYNIALYKTGNKKFRFFLFDLDHAGNVSKFPLLPKLEFITADIAKIYRAFQAKNGFIEHLENRKEELYNRFSVDDFNNVVNQLANNIENDIPFLIAKHGVPESIFRWKYNIEQLKRDFEKRDYYLRKKYNLD